MAPLKTIAALALGASAVSGFAPQAPLASKVSIERYGRAGTEGTVLAGRRLIGGRRGPLIPYLREGNRGPKLNREDTENWQGWRFSW